jgi:L-ascorbate metabolism protein UlaG (beta-lactamase superfamily)
MKLQLIRNATLKIKYAGKVFVIDPFLAPKHTVPSFAGVSPNPTVDLPCAPGEVVDGIEMVIISHLHPDHFDPVAQELLPNDVRMFCQPGDREQMVLFHNAQIIVEWLYHFLTPPNPNRLEASNKKSSSTLCCPILA